MKTGVIALGNLTAKLCKRKLALILKRSKMSLGAARTLGAVALASTALFYGGADAFASYSPSSATSYADQYAINGNGGMPGFSDDCANFVSQSLHAGGYSWDGWPGGSTTDDNNWYMAKACSYCSWQWTHSWTVVYNLDDFLARDYPGGWEWGSAPGTTGNYHSGLTSGDVLFYDWTGSGISHVSMQVLTGNYVDPVSQWTGDEIDQHTTNRKHAYWALTPYNQNASTTTIYLEHIDPNND